MKFFPNTIVLFGFGAVGKSVVEFLQKEITFPPGHLIILDENDPPPNMPYVYVKKRLTSQNYAEIFEGLLHSGDLLIDVSSCMNGLSIAKWCAKNEVMYINTCDSDSLEDDWHSFNDFYKDNEQFKQTHQTGTSILFHHGANPGAVSHFVKKGLEDITEELLQSETSLNKQKLYTLTSNRRFAELAQYIGLKTIQSTDYDTQLVAKNSLKKDIFYSTWNADTFYYESSFVSELCFGTDENLTPIQSKIRGIDATTGWLEMKFPSIRIRCRSWSPASEFIGTVVSHEETLTIAKNLTVTQNDKIIYRPSVYFVYKASEPAFNCLLDVIKKDLKPPFATKILNEEIVSGTEYVGVLLAGDHFKTRWVGNYVTLEQCGSSAVQTPTIAQVALPVVAAVSYMVDHPRVGARYPDELPHEEILSIMEKHTKTISTSTSFSIANSLAEDFIFE